MSKVHCQVPLLLLSIFLVQTAKARLTNPAIGILTESNIYVAQANELGYSHDRQFLIYHHDDPVYQLQSFTANNNLHRMYVCSPRTIYSMDLRLGATIVPLVPIDDTPCRSSLTYLPGESTLLWAVRRGIIQLAFEDMARDSLWNSSSVIVDMLHNDTSDSDRAIFYISIMINDRQSSILRCQTDNRMIPFLSCLFLDSGYGQITTLALKNNLLYAADRLQQRIYVLTLLPNGFIRRKEILPLNTSTVADIRSMVIYDDSLIWLTTSGHVRSFSLIDSRVRTIFWIDESLRSIRLFSMSAWPNRTTTAATTTTTITTTTAKVTTSPRTTSTSTLSPRTSIHTPSTSPGKDSETTAMANIGNPWKATAYVTSIILGIALFLCAAMMTCVLLNYRLGRVVPNSFTNIFHVLRHRTTVGTSVTLSMDSN